ncbi:MAG: hypothetical protein WBD87_14890 [Candidatus Acidiferrales bacterium]
MLSRLKWILPAILLFFAVLASPAFASGADVTFFLTGSYTECVYNFVPPNGYEIICSTNPVNGQFTVDVETNSILGDWFLNLGVEDIQGDGALVTGNSLANDQFELGDFTFNDEGFLYAGPNNEYLPCGPQGQVYCSMQVGAAEQPEPASFSLLAIGFCGLLLCGFWKRHMPPDHGLF